MKTLLITCCDPRVNPAILRGFKTDELFVVRNIANLVPPFKSKVPDLSTRAALEFGVLHLEIQNITILGHSDCRGIRTLMAPTATPPKDDFIRPWVEIAKPAKEAILREYPKCTLDEQVQHCEKKALLSSLNNLKTFPWIEERVSKKQLSLHACYFDINTGVTEHYQPDL